MARKWERRLQQPRPMVRCSEYKKIRIVRIIKNIRSLVSLQCWSSYSDSNSMRYCIEHTVFILISVIVLHGAHTAIVNDAHVTCTYVRTQRRRSTATHAPPLTVVSRFKAYIV
jgi:hypothetical protein